jgi:hypothetical protein
MLSLILLKRNKHASKGKKKLVFSSMCKYMLAYSDWHQRSPVRKARGERVEKEIKNKKQFLVQMYKRERII